MKYQTCNICFKKHFLHKYYTCNHKFCKSCFKQWGNNCPTCRSKQKIKIILGYNSDSNAVYY